MSKKEVLKKKDTPTTYRCNNKSGYIKRQLMFLINLDYHIARFYRFLYQPEVAVYQPKGHKADIQRPRADVACEIKNCHVMIFIFLTYWKYSSCNEN